MVWSPYSLADVAKLRRRLNEYQTHAVGQSARYARTLSLMRGVMFHKSKIMNIREASENDFYKIWPIFHEIVSAGETYAYPKKITKEEALQTWLKAPRKTFVAEENNNILGTYYIKTNQAGPGSHVCNCGYMVSSKARG
ncbi:MAG: N-acetyltransferase family protein, partial [Nitratireductor sp.]